VITASFAGESVFPFRLPHTVEESGHQQACRFTGGRLVNYRGGQAAVIAYAVIAYQMQQQKINLLV
jgi:hypothetical protein